jgi:hypothetical protein
MGQYHRLVNFTKKEYVVSYPLGNGAKLWEQVCWRHALSNVTHFLLARCSGRGGGDFHSEMAGRWGGDRVSLVGDYAEKNDFPFLSELEYAEMMKSVWSPSATKFIFKNIPARDSKGRFAKGPVAKGCKVKNALAATGYTDISKELAKEIEIEFNIKFKGDPDVWVNIIERTEKDKP